MSGDVIIYELMHGDRLTAQITSGGLSVVLDSQFMPYDLYLEETGAEDIEGRMNNLANFYHWCAGRVLPLDRIFAKEILNSIGQKQAVTDQDRAHLSLAYRCLSLTDVYWVKQQGETVSFDEVNLYDHSLNEALIEIPLRGKQMTATNEELAQDLSTGGLYPKAWVRRANGFQLYKDGGEEAVRAELLASRICACFDVRQVLYQEETFQGQLVSKSDIFTSKQCGIVTKAAFDIYAVNHDLDTLTVCRELDPQTYYGMNILDYLVGNTDRHAENWGFLVDNQTNRVLCLHPLMDFNQSFHSYDTVEGANCLTTLPEKMTQRQAAVEAVRKIGLPQLQPVHKEWFAGCPEWGEMFRLRLEELAREQG